MSPLTLSLPRVTLIDFTLSNARRFYSSNYGEPHRSERVKIVNCHKLSSSSSFWKVHGARRLCNANPLRLKQVASKDCCDSLSSLCFPCCPCFLYERAYCSLRNYSLYHNFFIIPVPQSAPV